MFSKVQTLRKIPQEYALEVINRYQVDKTLKESVPSDQSPQELIEQWLKEEKYNELVTFLCHALSAREAVWWGCLCLRMVEQELNDVQQQALSAAESWVRESTEANRRISETRAKRAELDNAAGWLAQAAFWSGGSITPIDGPANPAPPYLYSHAVAGAICLSAVLPDASNGKKNYKAMIRTGLIIADGGNGR
ncbi:Twin-arginine translocation pathway signal [Endozoicomonas sp. OPT23]|uniref:DUF6931 family protein n=1 Tax=Endozoicomonas sp. OPT23 TaxID=2072845 RepID=UPI00129ACFC4|nr:Twin-arginine translocation pathway signal [Endozoicomonas sp. OPT23]MRI32664.1 Twin-arginine translocation pathway signal [Endozoicomonas sp. OPT23]